MCRFISRYEVHFVHWSWSYLLLVSSPQGVRRSVFELYIAPLFWWHYRTILEGMIIFMILPDWTTDRRRGH